MNKVVGLSLASIAAGAAVSYYLFGTEKGRASREKMMGYAHDMKAKVMHMKDDAEVKICEMCGCENKSE